MKETFIIRTEWADAIFDLNQEDKATIFDNLFHYHLGNENLINLNNLTVKLVWKLIQPNLIRNIDQYDKRRETSSENGKKGGRPPKLPILEENNLNNLNNNLTKPNKALSVSVSVLDSVSDSVVIVKEDFEKIEKTEVPEFVRQQQQEFKEQLEKSTIPKVSKDETLIILKTDLDLINQVLREFRKNDIDTDYFCLTKNDIYKPTEDFKRWYESLVEDCVIKADNKQEYPKKLGDTKIHVINFLRYQDFQKLKVKLMPKVVRQPVYEEEYD